MKRCSLFVLAAGLLLMSACAGDGDTQRTPTNTVVVQATAAETRATATLEALSSAALPSPTIVTTSESPCPIADESFCDFAEDIDRALRRGDAAFIVQNSRTESATCPAGMQVGPCVGLPEGTVLEGHFVGADRTDGGYYASGEAYRSLLLAITEIEAGATDKYGDGTWKLAAILDYRPNTIVLISTAIGPDPIYQRATTPDRRVFTWAATFGTNEWTLGFFLTSLFVDEYLTGVSFAGGEPRAEWLPWGAP